MTFGQQTHSGAGTEQCNNAYCGPHCQGGQSQMINPLGETILEQEPTSCPGFKFRNCSNHLVFVWSRPMNDLIKD